MLHIIAENLRRYRRRSGYSMEILALKSKINKKTICSIENNKLIRDPHPNTLRKLIKPLNEAIEENLTVESLYKSFEK